MRLKSAADELPGVKPRTSICLGPAWAAQRMSATGLELTGVDLFPGAGAASAGCHLGSQYDGASCRKKWASNAFLRPDNRFGRFELVRGSVV